MGGCPVDRNIVDCVLHYQPELVLLFFLALVCAGCLWKFMDHQHTH
jgi:hypothetical protein